jgi:hypothetical protein
MSHIVVDHVYHEFYDSNFWLGTLIQFHIFYSSEIIVKQN